MNFVANFCLYLSMCFHLTPIVMVCLAVTLEFLKLLLLHSCMDNKPIIVLAACATKG
jgi:hypothetical protein